MNLKKIIAGLALSLTTLTSACAPIYKARLNEEYRCERTSAKDFKLFKGNKLLVEKVSKLNDVFDFYDKESKEARLRLLPDGSSKCVSTKKGEDLINEAYPIIKKCEETLEEKYKTNF